MVAAISSYLHEAGRIAGIVQNIQQYAGNIAVPA
jgi:hypothetical protein